MDLYVINRIDQWCERFGDYDTRLNLRQINHVCHTELPQLMFKLNGSDSPKPLSYVLTQSPNEIAKVALTHGFQYLLKCAIKVGFRNWNWGLQAACRDGHKSLVDLLIKYGANGWNWGLHEACHGGHTFLVQHMIDRGANNWNEGLHGACQGGHAFLVQHMIDRGANHWNWGLDGACQGGHESLVQLMIFMWSQ